MNQIRPACDVSRYGATPFDVAARIGRPMLMASVGFLGVMAVHHLLAPPNGRPPSRHGLRDLDGRDDRLELRGGSDAVQPRLGLRLGAATTAAAGLIAFGAPRVNQWSGFGIDVGGRAK